MRTITIKGEQFEIIGARKGNDGLDLRYTDKKQNKTIYPYYRVLIKRLER
jgi:hypothetical protein